MDTPHKNKQGKTYQGAVSGSSPLNEEYMAKVIPPAQKVSIMTLKSCSKNIGDISDHLVIRGFKDHRRVLSSNQSCLPVYLREPTVTYSLKIRDYRV